jgi:hypothetical protein
MSSFSVPLQFPVVRRSAIADGLVVALAVALPWSTSAESILVVLWLVALLPVLRWSDMRQILATPIGGLPVLLFALGLAGLVWADASWPERLDGLSGFVKLLVVPLLIAQFSRSDHGTRVLMAFLLSCIGLLAVSAIWTIFPGLPTGSGTTGVPVKSYIIQGLEFGLCAAVLVELAFEKAERGALMSCIGLLALAGAFIADILFVAASRTALVVVAALILVYGFRRSGWKGLLAALLFGTAVASIAFASSSYLRGRVEGVYLESLLYEEHNAVTSSGERLAFWKHGVNSIRLAPLIGHGTGSIRGEFHREAAGYTGPLGEISSNPHNQTLAVGMQVGVIGMLILWAMWLAQLRFCRGAGLIAWIALAVVVQNFVGSLFNSLIFDFTEGWLYVVGFGVTAGMLLRERTRAKESVGS